MNIDSTWLLLGLPAAFALGWLASRLDLRQLRTENRSAPKAYFKGLNHLLNEQQDAAIDAFIEAVQKDPDTTELHFALGSLFRRRGEYERAIRVHQHLLARADLSAADRARAQHGLSMDFLKAGLLNLAEDSLRQLKGTAFEHSAQLTLLHIYERSRDWLQADATAQELQAANEGQDFSQQRSHYLCEQAQLAQKKQQFETMRDLLQQAMALAPKAPRPRIQLAAFLQQQGDQPAALAQLEHVMAYAPTHAPLVAQTYAELAFACGQAEQARAQLAALQQAQPSIDLVNALVWLEEQSGAVQQTGGGAIHYIEHLQSTPSLMAAERWLNREKLAGDPNQPVIDKALQHAIRPLNRYQCAACGFEAQKHYWQCPGCHNWDSYPPRRIEEL
ncbi:MAG: lipopolysaccharide assembly protein LapB [Brachymonas sp.]|nr:lipopolysaccharide assembly protein LapB [Brachymonas sp.]